MKWVAIVLRTAARFPFLRNATQTYRAAKRLIAFLHEVAPNKKYTAISKI